jgi:hypothetical protein
MADRKGTYIAVDGLDQANPALSDFRYCGTIQTWAADTKIEVTYVNSHDKTYAINKSSLRTTLESRIKEGIGNSENVVIILSGGTKKSGSFLSFEIEQAVDRFELPLIITYVDYKVVADPSLLSEYWPDALRKRINNNTTKAIHIPFIKEALLDAMHQFNVSTRPETALNHYSEYAHRKFDCLSVSKPFDNHKK